MKLLFTGTSGFLGNNIRPLLEQKCDITTIGLMPEDNYVVNIAKQEPELYDVYDIVLHAAGKAHITPKIDEEKQLFLM